MESYFIIVLAFVSVVSTLKWLTLEQGVIEADGKNLTKKEMQKIHEALS